MPKSRPPYSEEFRREAVAMVRSGRKVSDVAEALGVTEQSLRTWVKQEALDRRERDDGLTSPEREELQRLGRENARLKQERDLLKRAAAFFARETETPPALPSEISLASRPSQARTLKWRKAAQIWEPRYPEPAPFRRRGSKSCPLQEVLMGTAGLEPATSRV
jgi:transposase